KARTHVPVCADDGGEFGHVAANRRIRSAAAYGGEVLLNPAQLARVLRGETRAEFVRGVPLPRAPNSVGVRHIPWLPGAVPGEVIGATKGMRIRDIDRQKRNLAGVEAPRQLDETRKLPVVGALQCDAHADRNDAIRGGTNAGADLVECVEAAYGPVCRGVGS